MKRVLVAMLFALALLASVSVAVAQAPLFKCYASSNHAFGYGWAVSPPMASEIALRQCAMNTPVHDACYVRWCVRER